MNFLTIRAEEFDEHGKSIKKHEKLAIDTKQFLIYGINETGIGYEDINTHIGNGANYVKLDLENKHHLRVYLQIINNRRLMAADLYELLLPKD